jgi:nitrite reductase/ring-hydroxylating ferredoxin subunit
VTTGLTAQGFLSVGAADLAPGELRSVRFGPGARVCLGNAGGELFAVADTCPHSEFPMSKGTIVDDKFIECGWHGAQFDCRNGDVVQGPADEPIRTYDVRIADGTVWVRTKP